MFDIKTAISGLSGALATVKSLTPLAEVLGLPAAVVDIANLAGAAVQIGTNIVNRIDEGKVVATTEDHGQVVAILTELQAENDKLAAKIDAG